MYVCMYVSICYVCVCTVGMTIMIWKIMELMHKHSYSSGGEASERLGICICACMYELYVYVCMYVLCIHSV